MPTLTEKEIRDKLNYWAELKASIAEVERREIDPLNKELAKTEKVITDWLETHGREQRVTSKNAIAEFTIEKKFGSRKLGAKEFLDAAADKGDAAYECLNVAIAKAEKLLGEDELNKISERPVIEQKKATIKLTT